MQTLTVSIYSTWLNRNSLEGGAQIALLGERECGRRRRTLQPVAALSLSEFGERLIVGAPDSHDLAPMQ